MELGRNHDCDYFYFIAQGQSWHGWQSTSQIVPREMTKFLKYWPHIWPKIHVISPNRFQVYILSWKKGKTKLTNYKEYPFTQKEKNRISIQFLAFPYLWLYEFYVKY